VRADERVVILATMRVVAAIVRSEPASALGVLYFQVQLGVAHGRCLARLASERR